MQTGKVKTLKETLEDERRKQEIIKEGFKTKEELEKEYENKIEQFDPTMLLGIEEFGQVPLVKKLQRSLVY